MVRVQASAAHAFLTLYAKQDEYFTVLLANISFCNRVILELDLRHIKRRWLVLAFLVNRNFQARC